MLQIPGYSLTGKLYRSRKTAIYRGVRLTDDTAVILKTLQNDPAPQILHNQLIHEYNILKSIAIDGVVAPLALETGADIPILVLPDNGSLSWKALTQHEPAPIGQFLQVAKQIARILGALHHANFIHRDITPTNIIVQPDSLQTQLIDFGLATRFVRDEPALATADQLSGTLAYMSPEQTGRMSRLVDNRTDFYSLGITFFEILTGQVPFTVEDPLDLIYSHIAQPMPLMRDLRPELPTILDDLVQKLCAKSAEARYQTGYGLLADLERCDQQWQLQQTISTFVLGEEDIADYLQMPQKLYGREADVAHLLAQITAVCEGKKSLTTIRGSAGIGKSSLVQEIIKPIVQANGILIRGKFNQFYNVPYEGIVQALQMWVQQILTRSEAELDAWRTKLQVALGNNGQLLVDVIPELALIIGPQPPVPVVGQVETQNRFRILIQSFLQLLTSHAQSPLVLFLDDLQWADRATLRWLYDIMRDPRICYFYLLTAFRDEQIHSAHPLHLFLQNLANEQIDVQVIQLGALQQTTIQQLLADTLKRPFSQFEALAGLIFQKTDGNPFFLNQFLLTLVEDGHIWFAADERAWKWDLQQIERQADTENVVELMVHKTRQLSEETQQSLQYASCIGTQFDLVTLANILAIDPASIAENLFPAIQAGLILPTFDFGSQEEHEANIAYRFVHDRVQEAAYTMLSLQDAQKIHYQLGKSLLAKQADGGNLFDVVEHFNQAIASITTRKEALLVARLNLEAGQRAMAATANESALNYLELGTTLLPDDCWQTEYELAYQLFSAWAQAAFFSSDMALMEQNAEVVLTHAQTTLEKVGIYEIRVQAAMVQNDPLTAVSIALEALRLLDVRLPANPNLMHVAVELVRTKMRLFRKSLPGLIQAKDMEDAHHIAAMRLLGTVGSAAYLAAPMLLPLIVFEEIKISLKYGNTAVSADAFATYGIILTGFLEDFDGGVEAGQLAYDLLEKYETKEFEPRTIIQVESAIRPWKAPLSGTIGPLLKAYHAGLEVGDLEFLGYAGFLHVLHSFFLGQPLPELIENLDNILATLQQLKIETAIQWSNILMQLMHNLHGEVEDPTILIGQYYDESVMVAQHEAANDGTALSYYYVCKLMLCTLMGEYETAVIQAERIQPHLESILGQYITTIFTFYATLAHIGCYGQALPKEQKRHSKVIKANLKKLKKWSIHAPENYAHKYQLALTQWQAVQNKSIAFLDAYDEAIHLAEQHGFPQEAILAQELAGAYWLSQDKERIGMLYLPDAIAGYRAWGAQAKETQLRSAFPQLVNRSSSSVLSSTTSTSTVLDSTAVYDLKTLLKFSRTLSEEILLDRLIDRLMQFLMENAGAQRNILILNQDNNWWVQAVADIEFETIYHLKEKRIEEYPKMPHTIVNYVRRMGEPVVLADAVTDSPYSEDAYILEHKPKSILCLPLLRQANLIGLLYLENRITAGAFSPERLQMLNLLTGQIAISLENARFYANMTKEVTRRKQIAEALRQKEKQLDLLLHQMPAILWTTDKELNFTSSVGGGLSLLNLETDQVSGISLFDYFETSDETFLPIQYQKRAIAGETISFEFEWLGQPFQTYLEPLFDDSGEIVGSLGIAVDVTDRKKAEEKLQAYNDLLQRSNLELQEFTFIASHDLQEPLRKIQLFSDMLAVKFEADLEAKSLDYLHRMQQSANRMQVLIENLLAFSLVTKEKRPFERVDLTKITDGILIDLADQISEKKAVINIDPLPIIEADPIQMRQLCYHLIDNALIYQPNGQKPMISIRSELFKEEGQTYCRIFVEDNGIGFEEKYLDRIFNVFQRLHGRSEYHGVGVGLAVCRKIVERHHGMITAESVLDEGSTFIITLPIVHANEQVTS